MIAMVELLQSANILIGLKIDLGIGAFITIYVLVLVVFQKQSSMVCPSCDKPIIYPTAGNFIFAISAPKKCTFCEKEF
jgi:hypothetical protein